MHNGNVDTMPSQCSLKHYYCNCPSIPAVGHKIPSRRIHTLQLECSNPSTALQQDDWYINFHLPFCHSPAKPVYFYHGNLLQL